jgi:RHS repeat-associated protein
MARLGIPLLVAFSALALAPSALGWSARTVPGLVSGGGSGGPLVPEVGGVVLDGKNGLSTSLRPTLRWPDAPSGQKQFEVLDLAGRSLWRFGSASGDARVNPGVLKQGGAYRWRATGSGKSYDGGIFRVDMQRASVQAAPSYSGVAVGAVSGETVFSWSSDRLGTLSGGVGLTLSFQPSNTQLQQKPVGLAPGWALSAGGGSEWNQLKVLSENWVELVSSTGTAIPFSRGSGGLWNAQLGAGQGWPGGLQVTLSSAADGTFSATDRNGVVALFPSARAGETVWARKVWAAGEPSMQQVFGSTGRLKALQDPVSGRSIKFIYRGVNETSELKCVEPKARHMQIAPAGYLCLTSGWEEPAGKPRPQNYKPQRNRFFYAQDGSRLVLARIVGDSQAGGQLSSVTDMAYDQAGRLKAVRSPLATRAVAAGILPGKPAADDPNVLTTISYDSAGRVSRVTRPAPLSCCGRTGPRAWRSFTWSAGDGQVTQAVRASDSSQTLSRLTSSVGTMLTTRSEDNTGAATTTEWDTKIEAPTKISHPGGLVETFAYDQLGNMIERRGPSSAVDSASAPVATYSFDTRLRGSDEVPQDGLQAFYFRGREFQGAPLVHQTGPVIGGSEPVSSLQFSWPSSPIASTTRDWSARLMGYVRVPQDGDFKFSAGQGTSLWISGQLCSPECSREGLKADQLLSIQVQAVSSTNGTGSVAVLWSGPGASGAIPSTNLRPGYPRPTQLGANDALSAGAGVQRLRTAMKFDGRNSMQLTEARSPSGKTAYREFEPYNPQGGQFGRATGSVSAAGVRSSTTYFGQRELATVPRECPGVGGETFDQAGLARERSMAGGVDTSQVYDPTGNIVAQRQNGELAICRAHDAAGDPVLSYSPGRDGQAPVKITSTYNLDGNPLRSGTQSTQGSTTRTTSTRVDILGREVESIDVWKTRTVYEYDSFDRPVRSTSTTGRGQKTTTSTTYNEAGLVESITVGRTRLATMSYDGNGRLSSVSYSNGARASYEYNQNGGTASRKLTVGGREISESVATAPSGRILSRTFDAPGANGSWSYSYDRDGRLTAAELSGTVPAGASAGTWTYELNDASQRVAITRPGTGRTTYSYGGAGEIEGTSDPRFGPQGDAQFEYDSRDRATRAGNLTFKYDPTGTVSQVADPTTKIDYQLSGGTAIAQTITTTDPATGQKSSKSVRFSAQGLILCPRCETGNAVSRMVPLPGGVTVELPIAAAEEPAASGRKAGSAEAKAAPAQASQPLWRYGDILGNAAWQAPGGAAPEETTIFDPDGNQLTEKPALSFDPASPNLRFQSAPATPTEIPVLAMGARTYIPALGMFMQPDPVNGAAPTPYNYANGDPVNYADPAGSVAWCWATFTKVTIGVVVGVAVAAMSAGTGAPLAMAALGAVEGAASSVISQGVVIAFQIPDANGNAQEDFSIGEILSSAAAGLAVGGVASQVGKKATTKGVTGALNKADEGGNLSVSLGSGGSKADGVDDFLSISGLSGGGEESMSHVALSLRSSVKSTDDQVGNLIVRLKNDAKAFQDWEVDRFLQASDKPDSEIRSILFGDQSNLPGWFKLPEGMQLHQSLIK